MSEIPEFIELKEINALKKQLTWGDVSAIYHMVASSAGELDGILTHGFESGFTNILDKEQWNLALLKGSKDANGKIVVATRPKISLRHVYNDMGYELHCYPIINGERINQNLINHPLCPFQRWIPEAMRRLFRVNSLKSFVILTAEMGDQADVLLVRHIYRRVERLIRYLDESFDIVEVKGPTIARFFQEAVKHNNDLLSADLANSNNNQVE
ncbi:hypothetical protein DXX93_09210 [Thalassotalea euphylliae]|uniref:Uncharacterized protein n=1 Tax=Thalassotalea euphylliae TaxID=1655234 RepID=A0A3E0TQL0_9GAMM|nr:hypothetical protein [Thalassotalea euphylliae]REL26733.1 hypothetical protein DXX93_09210 [Thalassotalea euphylliae]